MYKLLFTIVFASFVLTGCGTDNPFDRGQDLPAGSNEENPNGQLVSFSADVKPVLQVCASCHAGGAGGWVYAGSAEAYSRTIAKIDVQQPEKSVLLIKATGGGHGGGTLFGTGSSSYQTIVNWIAQGAKNN